MIADNDTIELLIVDDHAMFREGLTRSLEREAGFRVVGSCASVAEALAVLRTRSVSVVLLDIELRGERGTALLPAARREGFEGYILVVTAGVSDVEAVQLIQSGVLGIFHKQHSIEALCCAIREVARGKPILENDYLQSMFRTMSRAEGSSRPTLSSRDRTLLRFILKGHTNRRISEELDLSEGTVKSSLRQLFDKLGVRTRAQLVRIALEDYREEL
jgi:two-component system, NarL family, nitrate/nitrite response regulator NarL